MLSMYVFVSLLGGQVTAWCDVPLLNKVTEALERSLDFMKREVASINLDGALGPRIVEDQLSYILDSLPPLSETSDSLAQLLKKISYLRNLAGDVTDEAIPYILESQKDYYKKVGAVLEKGQWDLRYASRPLDSSLQTKPKNCSEIPLLEHISDRCFSELLGTSEVASERCNISEKCWEIMTAPGYKGYALTHQVLYLEIGEMNGCLPRMNKKSTKGVGYLQDYFCANVFRDAVGITKHHFPDSDQDLFMEQVGLCGLLGYKDMFQNTWLKEMLSWQQPSGCYTRKKDQHWLCKDEDTAVHKNRYKREEKKLEGGCLSHKTSVAITALVTNLKFCFEEANLS